jgi:hypothetical protein
MCLARNWVDMISSEEAHSKVECDLLALLFRSGMEAGLLVSVELVGQSGSSDIGGEAGEKPGDKCW